MLGSLTLSSLMSPWTEEGRDWEEHKGSAPAGLWRHARARLGRSKGPARTPDGAFLIAAALERPTSPGPLRHKRRRAPNPPRPGPLTEACRVVEELHRCGHLNEHLAAGREWQLFLAAIVPVWRLLVT
jgi:hypothetical protein